MLLIFKNWQKFLFCILVSILFPLASSAKAVRLYSWVEGSEEYAQSVSEAEERLERAIANPEFMLNNWINLPQSPDAANRKVHQLNLREAILLALRYNPNIQNAELDRIIQRYQLRLAHNEFELQYALAGSAAIERSQYSGVGSTTNKSYMGTPELSWKSPFGTTMSLNLDNNVSNYNSYSPVLNFSINQPLLRGFGRDVNQNSLLNAIDSEWLNKLNLQQAVTDQITQVIVAYRALILSANNLQNQKMQLKEAKKTYQINEKKIAAGQLEPTGNIQQSYQVESISLLVEQAENDFKIASQNLLQMIGLDPKMRLSVPSNVVLNKIILPNLKESIDWAFAHNTQFLAQQMRMRADERAYNLAKNQQLWQLDVGANVQSGRVNNVDNTNNRPQSIYSGQNLNQTARVKLTIPLHDLNRRNQLISAKIRLEKDRLDLIAMKRSLETTITNTISNIESLAKRYQLAEKQVGLAEKSYVLEKKKQQAGISSALDVNNTQNQLIQAQMGLIAAKIAYLNQLSTLDRILGKTLEHWHIKFRYCG